MYLETRKLICSGIWSDVARVSVSKIYHVLELEKGHVLLNLITNAFYACIQKNKLELSDYKPTVVITTKWIGDAVIIKVKDNGNGISIEFVD